MPCSFRRSSSVYYILRQKLLGKRDSWKGGITGASSVSDAESFSATSSIRAEASSSDGSCNDGHALDASLSVAEKHSTELDPSVVDSVSSQGVARL